MLSLRRARRILAASALLAALSGCAGTPAVGSSRILRVALTEYRVAPGAVHAAPGPLTVVARNFGRVMHNLAIVRNHRLVAETRPIPPGANAVLRLYVSAGTYTLTSNLLADQALGMHATLTVG